MWSEILNFIKELRNDEITDKYIFKKSILPQYPTGVTEEKNAQCWRFLI
jgi:hypothetical protein